MPTVTGATPHLPMQEKERAMRPIERRCGTLHSLLADWPHVYSTPTKIPPRRHTGVKEAIVARRSPTVANFPRLPGSWQETAAMNELHDHHRNSTRLSQQGSTQPKRNIAMRRQPSTDRSVRPPSAIETVDEGRTVDAIREQATKHHCGDGPNRPTPPWH
jgi:hypothetical protein